MRNVTWSVARRQTFVRCLLRWYRSHRRDLPWRRTHDPYRILVSEVMLQQTQVSRVLPKYLEWLEHFPTMQKLAKATPAEVIRAWAGLGYNRRALHLQRAVQQILKRFRGHFPRTGEELESLPGVGRYTANAIRCFAFGQPAEVMDANVRRILRRVFFGLTKTLPDDEELWVMSEKLLPKRRFYEYNQALMDFGALICFSRRHKCELCPFQKICQAYPKILEQGDGPAKPNRERFVGSSRYYRGKIVAVLRDVLPGKVVTFSRLKRLLQNIGVTLTPGDLRHYLDTLAHDQLVERQGSRVRLP